MKVTQTAKQLANKEQYTMEDLLAITKLLRDPNDGCPWDKVQTHASIRKNFIEETYEVADAIDLNDAHLLCEELGDVLLQVALHTQMEQEQDTFSFADVCTGICQKLIHRHPHIFKETKAETSQEVLENWEQLKRQEKQRESLSDDLQSVPAALPALMRAGKLSKRAAQHGIAQQSKEEAFKTLAREMDKLQKMQSKKALGDLLFAAADLSRYLDCDAEEALTETSNAFIAQYKD